MLTENSVGNQLELLRIILDLEEIRLHTKHSVVVLVDMDIHYRMLKLMYGQSTQPYRLREKLINYAFIYGICRGFG